MNFILKDARQGLEIQVQSGRWYDASQPDIANGLEAKGGGETDFKVAANLGLPLTEKGFINLSGEYTRNPELSRGIQHFSADCAQHALHHQGVPVAPGREKLVYINQGDQKAERQMQYRLVTV